MNNPETGTVYRFLIYPIVFLTKKLPIVCTPLTFTHYYRAIKIKTINKKNGGFQMTIYFNPYMRNFRRRAMAQMLNEMDSEYEQQVSFPIDVKGSADLYELKALLPGVDADDLDIQIVNEVVTISGLMKVEREEQAEYLLTELPSGRFHRVVSLPTPLDASKVEAILENGILTLRIPKAEEARPKTIKILKKKLTVNK